MQEPAGVSGHGRNGELVQLRILTEGLAPQPELVKLDSQHVDAIGSEWMDIAVSRPQPVDEFDPQLIRRAGLSHELEFVYAKQIVERYDLRDRGFADPDRADCLAFHQIDGKTGKVAHDMRNSRCRHPSSSSPTYDNNPAYRFSVHCMAPAAAIGA